MPVTVATGQRPGYYFDVLSGLAQGLAGGAAVQEDTRRFNVTADLQRDTLDANIQQANLDRDQRDFLAGMQDRRERELARAELDAALQRQVSQQAFQEHLVTNVQLPFEARQNEENRKVTREGQRLDYKKSVLATMKGWEANMAGIAAERERLQTDSGRELDFAQQVLAGRKYADLSPEERYTALQRMTAYYTGPERVNGAPGVPQASGAEVLNARNQAEMMLTNYEGRQKAYLDKLQESFKREAWAQSGLSSLSDPNRPPVLAPPPGSRLTPDQESTMTKEDVTRSENWRNLPPAFAGSAPRLVSDLGPDLQYDRNILKVLAQGTMLVSYGYDYNTRLNYKSELRGQIDSQLDQMLNRSPDVKRYYYDLLDRALLPDSGKYDTEELAPMGVGSQQQGFGVGVNPNVQQ